MIFCIRRKMRWIFRVDCSQEQLKDTQMLYHAYELNHALVKPLRALAKMNLSLLDKDFNPYARSYPARATAAGIEVFERLTKRYEKPRFGLDAVEIDDEPVDITEGIVLRKPFCDLKHFQRCPWDDKPPANDPKVLLVAPMSGHYATLLRGTVERLLPEHDVYITDWQDAREISLDLGQFDLHDYIDYVMEFVRFLGEDTHVVAVCQPGPAVVVATALMAMSKDAATPASVTLMGSPIDTRMSPTKPNELALSKPLSWFESNAIMRVPHPNKGAMRRVYPGFAQLSGFMSMNADRHWNAHQKLFTDLIVGDGDSVDAHRRFYDEYLAVMDLTAEYYLQTIDLVFQRHLLPERRFYHRGQHVDTRAICDTALMTVEGELDDISGIGQTQAAHDLFSRVPKERHVDYIQPGVGHYGVFNGSRWRSEIAPRIRDFIRSNRA